MVGNVQLRTAMQPWHRTLPPSCSPWQVHILPPPALATPAGTPLEAITTDQRRSLLLIAQKYRPLLRHIPKGAAKEWGKELASCIQDFAEHQTFEALAKLLFLPKATLGAPAVPRGGEKERRRIMQLVLQRLECFRKGEMAALWTKYCPGPVTRSKSPVRQPRAKDRRWQIRQRGCMKTNSPGP